jgi:putative addiction module antidote
VKTVYSVDRFVPPKFEKKLLRGEGQAALTVTLSRRPSASATLSTVAKSDAGKQGTYHLYLVNVVRPLFLTPSRISAGIVLCGVAEDYNDRYNCGTFKTGSLAMATVKLTTVGNSVGVVLPRELLAKLRVEKGDTLYVLETPDGIELTPYRPDFGEQMDAAESIMREHRDVLRKLAR